MTLEQAAQTYRVAGLDPAWLVGQEGAFQTCMEFLRGVGKAKRQYWRSSYGLKHIVEFPAGRYDIPCEVDCYNGYIYEGTFILAALASGFTMRQHGMGLSVTFNISERSLIQRAREFAYEGRHDSQLPSSTETR
jgi:hypothetical protein